MTFHFPNMTRPKKASVRLARALSAPLASTQRAIAKACGYPDWHGLEASVSRETPSPLDQAIEPEAYIQRQAALVTSIAISLDRPSGDVQYALSDARLSGDRLPLLDEQIALRLAIWRSTILPDAPKRTPGAVGKLRTPGHNGEHVILRSFGRPTYVVTHRGIMTVADFEYISPRNVLPIFLPMRLYMPYGFWTEPSGAKVLFSRDYKPLWRLQESGVPERLEPWLWIKKISETHLWPDQTYPWYSSALYRELLALLRKNNINELPMLTDCLPILVLNQAERVVSMSDAPAMLKQERAAAPPDGLDHSERQIETV